MITLFGMPGLPEILVIVVAIMLLFGAKAIPSLIRGVGQGIRDFRLAQNEVSKELRAGVKQAEEDAKLLKEKIEK